MKAIGALIELILLAVKTVKGIKRKTEREDIRTDSSDEWNACFGVHIESKDSTTKTDTK